MMKILQPHCHNNWITAVIQNRWCQAKVYNEPSTFGINNGRVSKLIILKTPYRIDGNIFDQADFNYDRGLDFDTLPEGVLNKILTELESLPKI